MRVLRSEKGLNWVVGANFTRNRNNVEKLDESVEEFAIGGLSTTSIVAVAGQPIGMFKGNVPKTDSLGRMIVDANGVPVAATEKGIYGNIQQKYILGINNTFRWRGFSLSFTFDIRKGGLMFSRTADINYFTGNGINTTYNNRKPFVVPNSVVEIDNGDGTYSYEENTIAVDPAHMDDYFRADAWDRWHVIDKSFTKLREVNFTYTVPNALLERMPFTGLRVSLIGRNLFLWTPVDNQFIDPETTSFGNGLEAEFGEFSANPTTRSYGFALVFTL